MIWWYNIKSNKHAGGIEMFYTPKFQTGESAEVAEKMRNGEIPMLEVTDYDDFMFFVSLLEKQGIFLIEDAPLDKNARDTVEEPQFEFRACFYKSKTSLADAEHDKIMYIDVYFEPVPEETYDSTGEM